MNFVFILSLLRSLTFGGILGAIVAGILFLTFPHFFMPHLTLEKTMTLGGLLGGATHRFIDIFLIKGIFYPIGKAAGYYKTDFELDMQRKRNMDEETYKFIKRQLDERYFLGTSEPSVLEDKPKLLEDKSKRVWGKKIE